MVLNFGGRGLHRAKETYVKNNGFSTRTMGRVKYIVGLDRPAMGGSEPVPCFGFACFIIYLQGPALPLGTENAILGQLGVGKPLSWLCEAQN